MNKTKKGGPRPGSGRPHLNGQRPGQGEYLRKITVSLPADLIDWLREIGEGNVSRGIRRLAEIAREERLEYMITAIATGDEGECNESH